jgi:hypothetical protein
MKMVPDALHRFVSRPQYEPWELDVACEEVVGKFLEDRHGTVRFPISTADLTLLLEAETEDLDSAADLSDLGSDVEGVTDFFRDRKPSVRIASDLWAGTSRENRLRTTLAHEFGHVHFHNYLYQVEAGPQLFAAAGHVPLQCRREQITGAARRDWMEWQAGYTSGALLMPASLSLKQAKAFGEEVGARPPFHENSPEAAELITLLSAAFQVSRDAARVRLSQLGFLTRAPQETLPFS